jgi:hypothetical protein
MQGRGGIIKFALKKYCVSVYIELIYLRMEDSSGLLGTQ